VADRPPTTAISQRKLAINPNLTEGSKHEEHRPSRAGWHRCNRAWTFLMVPLGLLFDAMNWPLFHTFDLAHKSFFIAWPILAFFNLVLLRLLIRTWRLQRAEQ
jgi:hypothetical protein